MHGVQEKWAATAAAVAADKRAEAARRDATRFDDEKILPPGMAGDGCAMVDKNNSNYGCSAGGGDGSRGQSSAAFANRGGDFSSSRLSAQDVGGGSMDVAGSCSRRASAAFGLMGGGSQGEGASTAAGGDTVPKVSLGDVEDAMMTDGGDGGGGDGADRGGGSGRTGGGAGGGSIASLDWSSFAAHPAM